MNGQELITLTEPKLVKFNFASTFHAKKVLVHSENLRKAVLNAAYTSRPSEFRDWRDVHVASVLFHDHGYHVAALAVLAAKLHGQCLIDLNDREIEQQLSGTILTLNLHSRI